MPESLCRILEIDLSHCSQHVEANDDQRRSRRKGRDCEEDRGQEQREQEKNTGCQRSQTGTAALRYTRRIFWSREGMPWMTVSFTLIHAVAGKPYR